MHNFSLPQFARYTTRRLRDVVENHGRASVRPRILIVRHPLVARKYHRSFLHWLATRLPEVHQACEVRSIPFQLRDWSQYAVTMSWVGDSALAPGNWELTTMQQLNQILRSHKIPIVNPLVGTLRSAKHAAALTMARSGLRSPRTSHVLTDSSNLHGLRDLDKLRFPLLIRENYGHASSRSMQVIHNADELQRINLNLFHQPVAVEFIDTCHDDQCYRRYRYVAAGNIGMSYSLDISEQWQVHEKSRLNTESTLREERDFIARPNAHHQEFQRARKALGLEFVSFDYSYDRQGRLVVWEANSLPVVAYVRQPERQFLNRNVEAVFAAMTHRLLQQAGLPIPDNIPKILSLTPAINLGSARAA